MDSRTSKDVSMSHLFEQFIEAATMKNVLSIHSKILNHAELIPCEFNVFFPRYKRAVTSNKQRKNWKAKALLSKLDKRAASKCYSNTKSTLYTHSNKTCDAPISTIDDSYEDKCNINYSNNNALQSYNCLVIGSGPAGLRTAIELQLLGASKVCIVEKRSRFSRNNVLHLWPFVIDDLKSLGAKKFYGKFCAGSIDHISIRQLQLILLKVCLMVGCDFRESCSYEYLCPESIKQPVGSHCATGSDGDISSDNRKSSFNQKTSCNMSVCGHEQSSVENNKINISPSIRSHNQTNDRIRDNIQDSNECDVLNSTGENYDDLNNTTPNDTSKLGFRRSINPMYCSSTSIGDLTTKRPDNLRGSNAHFECDSREQEKELHSYEWDIVVGADGRRNTLSRFFPRKEFRGRLAIAITANFINRQSQAETAVPEISGLSFIYNQDMFNALAYDTNIQLENICYYKDDTHYFVMTAKKKSLLERGVLIRDHATTQDLLSDNNVNKEALLGYAKDAAFWTTGLDPLDFALNHYGQEDCAMFDFTSMYAASNACKALRTTGGGFTLISLVGDSLLEPFWPTGSGCARGFLSSFDAAWMCRQWAVNKCATISYHSSLGIRANRQKSNSSQSGMKEETDAKVMVSPTTYDRMALSVMAERESIYRILAQTTSENLQQNYSHWTLNPHTRYPNLNRHLVLPSQVEHLISDGSTRINISDLDSSRDHKSSNKLSNRNARRIKSPNSHSPRKSPKKLKSAGASPVALPKNLKNRSKSLSKYCNSKSQRDLELVDSYLEFEQSYRDLAKSENNGMTQYLDYRPRDSTLEDLFIPSLSGTLPSSNNLSHLEARKARDIDDCLRQRRQKTKINFVREQLINQLRGESHERNGRCKSPILSGGNAVLFNEIKRLREQQSTVDGRAGNVNGPLSLLNSMRRCASFAERVKSFENKLVQSNGNQSSESTVTTPKTPIDNVKNLPQFATLQELIVSNSSTKDTDIRRSRIPVTKLSKEDWNVKCWESRFKSPGLDAARGASVPNSRPTLQRFMSEDHPNQKPKKQVDIFQDRIKEMAEKLKTSKEKNQRLYQSMEQTMCKNNLDTTNKTSFNGTSVRSQGWINHLKRELVKTAGDVGPRSHQPMNPVAPNRPIKKLFEDDDDEDDDGIDVDKHYDHLCVNRPTNKYLSKGAYTSHLARSRFNTTSKIINRPTAERKQAYLSALTSRGSSASSTLSDYSTNTVNSSSGGSNKQQQQQHKRHTTTSILDVDCARCKKFVSSSDRITIGNSNLHRLCLTCSGCCLTLRSTEIQFYLSSASSSDEKERSFLCAICKPEIRAELSRESNSRLAKLPADAYTNGTAGAGESNEELQQQPGLLKPRLQSREEFLDSQINYNDLYRNILPAGIKDGRQKSKITPSPIQITLPLNVVKGGQDEHSIDRPKAATAGIAESLARPSFRVANRETIDGKELITLILPPSTSPSARPDTLPIEEDEDGAIIERDIKEGSGLEIGLSLQSKKGAEQQHDLIDEDELNRILHLDVEQRCDTSKTSSSATELSSSDVGEEDDDEESGSSIGSSPAVKTSALARVSEARRKVATATGFSDEESSSLSLASGSDEDEEFEDVEDEQENIDPNSTCNDFVSSEEFDDVAPASGHDLDTDSKQVVAEIASTQSRKLV